MNADQQKRNRREKKKQQKIIIKQNDKIFRIWEKIILFGCDLHVNTLSLLFSGSVS